MVRRVNGKHWIHWFCGAWLALLAAGASAAVALDEGLIDRWLKSQGELQAWAMEHREQLEPHESPDAWSDLQSTDNMLRSLKAAGLYEEAGDILEPHGFKAPEEWADATIRIIKAYLANELEGRDQEIETLRSEVAAMEQNSAIPEEQKAAVLQALRDNLAMVDLVRTAPEEDRQAIQPHMEKIRQHLSAQEAQAQPAPSGPQS